MDVKELLNHMNLTPEQVDQMVKGIEDIYKDYVPKHRFDEVNEAKKQLETDMKERDKQLSLLKKGVGDHEVLKKQIDLLQTENKAKEEAYQTKIKDMAMDSAIKLSLANQVRDVDIIINLLDKTKIDMDESGQVKTGLDDQIKSLRESKDFLFVDKQEIQPSFKGVTPTDSTIGLKSEKESTGSNYAKQANEGGKSVIKNIWE